MDPWWCGGGYIKSRELLGHVAGEEEVVEGREGEEEEVEPVSTCLFKEGSASPTSSIELTLR